MNEEAAAAFAYMWGSWSQRLLDIRDSAHTTATAMRMTSLIYRRIEEGVAALFDGRD